MNGAHLHLLFNHLPVVGMVGAAAVLAVAVASRSDDVRRLALVVLLLTGISALPAYFTGEGAEGVVKHLPGVVQDRIEEHEASGKWALGVAIVAGAFALGALVARRGKPVGRGLATAALVLALFGVAVFARTATLGGEIRHEEIRKGFVPPAPPPGQPQPETD